MPILSRLNVRPPWQDELPRVQHFLPSPFLFEERPVLRIATIGQVERIVGAVGLNLRATHEANFAWISERVEKMDESNTIARQLREEILEEAWRSGAVRVFYALTVPEESETAAILREQGFHPMATHEIYEVEAPRLWERLDRTYQRATASGRIPASAQVVSLQPAAIPLLRQFLLQHLPESSSLLALETNGYRWENSFVLVMDDEIKGALLCRSSGDVSTVGLRVVAPELRTVAGWANLLMLHVSLRSALGAGVRRNRFEFDPATHADTKQFAQNCGANYVGRRLLFCIDREEKD